MHNRFFHHYKINVEPTQGVILNVFIHTMSDNDFEYIQLLILNIPYTFILGHLKNFPIDTIVWVVGVKDRCAWFEVTSIFLLGDLGPGIGNDMKKFDSFMHF